MSVALKVFLDTASILAVNCVTLVLVLAIIPSALFTRVVNADNADPSALVANPFSTVVTLPCSVVIFDALVVTLPSMVVTLLSSAVSADESALVAARLLAALAAAKASVATLSVTTTHAVPFQRLGVLAFPVVSIHRF